VLLVALTGAIASGKSLAAQVFAELGCYVENSDQTAHELMRPQTPAWKEIVAHFGDRILNPDSTIDRRRLGAIIFARPEERRFLDELIHPLVFALKKERIASLRKKQAYDIFVSEAALTIEAGFIGFFDRVVVTDCPRDILITRLSQRDRITADEARQRLQSQLSPEKKREYADYIIDTSGSIPSTIEQTERVYRYLLLDFQALYS
jgi:dephospho-CoA kinase